MPNSERLTQFLAFCHGSASYDRVEHFPRLSHHGEHRLMVGLPFFVAGPYCAPPASRQRVCPTASSSRSSRTSTSDPKYARMIATRVRPSFLVASVLSRNEREMYGWGRLYQARCWRISCHSSMERPTSGRGNCRYRPGTSPSTSSGARRILRRPHLRTHSPDDRPPHVH